MIAENKYHEGIKNEGWRIKNTFENSKIPTLFIENGIAKALAIPQEQLNGKLKNNDDILPFLSKYNLSNSNVFPKVREIYRNFTWHELIVQDSLQVKKDSDVLQTFQWTNQYLLVLLLLQRMSSSIVGTKFWNFDLLLIWFKILICFYFNPKRSDNLPFPGTFSENGRQLLNFKTATL